MNHYHHVNHKHADVTDVTTSTVVALGQQRLRLFEQQQQLHNWKQLMVERLRMMDAMSSSEHDSHGNEEVQRVIHELLHMLTVNDNGNSNSNSNSNSIS